MLRHHLGNRVVGNPMRGSRQGGLVKGMAAVYWAASCAQLWPFLS